MAVLDARVKVGTFTWDSGASPKVVTGVGFQPKALIIFSPLMTTLNSWAAEAHIAAGLASTASNDSARRFVSGWDNVAFFTIRDNEGELATNVMLYEISAFGTLLTSVALTAIGSDGFTLTPTLANANGVFGYIAFGGADLTAAVGTTNWNTAAAAQSVNAGIAPSLVYFQGGGDGTTQCWSQGWCDSLNRNAVSSFSQRSIWPTAMNTDNKSYQSASSCLVIHHPTTGAIAAEASAALTATGFDLNWSTIYGTAGTFRWLAISGLQAHVGTLNQPTAAGLQTVGSLTVDPSSVFFQSAGQVAGAGITDILRHSIGFSNVSSSFGLALADNDNLPWATQRTTRRLAASGRAIELVTPTAANNGTIDAAAALASVGSRLFTLNWAVADATARQVVFVAFGAGAETSYETNQQTGGIIGIHWIHFLDAIGVDHIWSKVDLADPATYYGGFKSAIVKTWGLIKRSLSDRRGQHEASTFSWTVSDTTREVRGLLAGATTRFFTGNNVVMRSIEDRLRRLLQTPLTVVRGIVRDYRPLSPLLFEFTAEDYFAAQFEVGTEEQQIPKRTISRVDFPSCPIETINAPVPIIYGDETSAGLSATPAPVISGDPTLGAFVDDGGNWVTGSANMASAAAVPSGVTVGLAAGGTLSTDVPNGEYGVIVTAVDVNGNESDPQVMYFGGPSIGRGSFASGPLSPSYVAAPDGTEKIQVSWSASAGAVKYRVYLSYYYFGARWQQRIEVTAPTTSTEFTDGWAWGSVPAPSAPGAYTPGATGPLFQWFGWYAVTAIMPDGETAKTADIFGASGPYRRTMRVQWIPVVGATGYRIYRRGLGTWDRRWTVAGQATNFFDDDLLDTGVEYLAAEVPHGGHAPTYVGQMADSSGFLWQAFLVAGHAVKEIPACYQNGIRIDPGKFGVDWAVPGQTGFATYFPNTGSVQYRDINGHRYTLLYVRGPDGDDAANGVRKISVDVKGIESVGDSSGSLITSIPLQYLHALQNWGIGNYLSGAWLSSPTMPDDATLSQIDEASFAAVDVILQTRIPGGYVGAGVIGARGEFVSLRDFMARWITSLGADGGFSRKTQYMVTAINDSPAVLASALSFDAVTDIIADTFETTDEVPEMFNRTPASYDRDYSGQGNADWRQTFLLSNSSSIANYRQTRTAERLFLYFVRAAGTAGNIMARRLYLSSDPPRWVRFTTGLRGLSVELGDVILVTHHGGIGSAGWTNQPIRITRHEFNPDAYTVTLEGYDVSKIYTPPISLGNEFSPATAIASNQVIDMRRRRRDWIRTLAPIEFRRPN